MEVFTISSYQVALRFRLRRLCGTSRACEADEGQFQQKAQNSNAHIRAFYTRIEACPWNLPFQLLFLLLLVEGSSFQVHTITRATCRAHTENRTT